MTAGDPLSRELDIDHLAELANLPLDEDEREALAEACRHVLEAFALEDVGGQPEPGGPVPLFADEGEPWPADGVAAILDQVPRRDGRYLSP